MFSEKGIEAKINMRNLVIVPGDIIQDYEIIEEIGRGGFATVFKVRHIRCHIIYAAKFIFMNENELEKGKSSFERETQSLMNIDHPNIIKLYQSFQYLTSYVLILEYCSGGTLNDEIKRYGNLSPEKFHSVASSLTRAIGYLHGLGISHQDIKPQNILFDTMGRPKISDFGISVRTILNERIQSLGFSPKYSAPEQQKCLFHCPFKADIWSLGLTFFFMVSGIEPTVQQSSDTLSLFQMLNWHFMKGTIPHQIRSVIKTMVRINPDDRITINDLASLLSSFDIESDSSETPTPLNRKVSRSTTNLKKTSLILMQNSHLNLRRKKQNDLFPIETFG